MSTSLSHPPHADSPIRRAAVLFAGDDLGDVPAVRRVRSWAVASGRPAVTIAVGGVEELREETTIALQSPAELASLLAELTAR